MTRIDADGLHGEELDLFSCGRSSHHSNDRPSPPHKSSDVRDEKDRGRTQDDGDMVLYKPSKKAKDGTGKGEKRVRFEKSKTRESHRDREKDKNRPKGQSTHVGGGGVSATYFSKVELYANSKLPTNLPPLSVYVPTWQLLNLAADYSSRVYDPPKPDERETHVSASWLDRTKAMRIKSVPFDSVNTIVFAIRGTTSFMDWAVNLNSAPISPSGFLDDPGNLCHAGFLSTARKMVPKVASLLRDLLTEDPGRERYSLLITGHSAGGAIAALLYCHMLATTAEASSDLNAMTCRFKRVHCVTFGTPPISLLPLQKPATQELKRSLFMSFINEGDPVVRAEKPYVKSLLELLATPAPESTSNKSKPNTKDTKNTSRSKTDLILSSHSSSSSKPTWPVPQATLSNAGRLVVLRPPPRKHRSSSRPRGGSGDHHQQQMTIKDRLKEGVVAVTCREDQLRGVVYGDPMAHMMALYRDRIRVLSVMAITGKSR